jgi:uncharacterized membrane protein
MIFLALIVLLAVTGVLIAAPLFEFVFGALLLVPVFRFLLGFGLLKLGYAVPNGPASFFLYAISFLFVFSVALKVFGRRRRELDRAELYPLLFFALVYGFSYSLCMMWPDFVDLGERLRDYAVLAASIDSPVLPLDPWMDGVKLNYYVYWYRFGNLLSTVLGMEVWQIYHVMLSFSMSLYAATIFQIVRSIIRAPISAAAVAGFLIPFGSNVAGIFSLKRAEQGMGWEPDNGWWGPSRVISGAIDEFPAWSFVLGDAHPHFLNLAAFPFFILVLYRIASSSAQGLPRLTQSVLFIIGATLFLMASNAWEVPMWLGTVGATSLLGWFFLRSKSVPSQPVKLERPPLFEIFKGCVAIGIVTAAVLCAYVNFNQSTPLLRLAVLALGVSFFAFAFPFKIVLSRLPEARLTTIPSPQLVVFWVLLFIALKASSHHIAPEGVSFDLVRSPIPVTTTAEILMHWGVQFALLAMGSILLLRASFESVVMVGFLGLAVVYDKAALLIYSLIALQVVRLLADRQAGKPVGWAYVFENSIIISGLVLVLTPEIVFVNDSYGGDIERMNTIFKIYTTAWGLLGLGAVSVLHQSFKKFNSQLTAPGPFLPTIVGGLLTLALIIASSFFYRHTAPMRWGGLESKGAARSEGLATANRWHPGSADTIRALRELPRGRVLEAQGRAYSYTCFVSTLAAQPSYLGWANHINLLTKESGEVNRREKMTDQIYTERDCSVRKELAKNERISYIVVGTLERKKYTDIDSRDFSCFSPVVKTGEYALYQIPLS